ncbi:hypothetical protein [Sphingobacterium daejeonense]|uniref:hypothetical protein n=1 Tax=Sphingobacterium daejeonense TaxID=371142 RepID=UPI0010FF3ACA|nr:hypothetical protein [Sphingobacterium daejeonense]
MYRFWDETPAYDRKGDRKVKNNEFVSQYQISVERILNFLVKSGFGRRKVNEETIEYVQIDGNLVRQVKPEDIKSFLISFLRSRFLDEDLLNVIHKSTVLSEKSFESLPMVDPDFRDHDPWTQFVFFQNITWKITSGGIEEIPNSKVDKMVWEPKILKHKVRKLEPMFLVTQDETKKYHLEVRDSSSMFFRFLMQTSRIYWRRELEDNLEDLTVEQREEYKIRTSLRSMGRT